MSTCKINVKINNELKQFDSMEALDAYLVEHQDSIEDITIEDGIMFDSRPEHEKLKEMFNNTSEANIRSTAARYNAIPASPSNMWGYIEKDESTHATYLSQYSVVNGREKFKRAHPELSGSELEKAWKKENAKGRETGDAIHNALDVFWKTQKTDRTNAILARRITLGQELTFEEDVKSALQEIHGEKFIPISELPVFSKWLEEKYVETITKARINSLKAQIIAQKNAGVPEAEIEKLERDLSKLEGTKTTDPHKINYVSGRIDLVVQDEFGVFHLYDYKSHDVGHSFSDSAKKSALFQLETYAAILRQAGFKVGSVGIIEIGVSDKTIALEKIERFNRSTFPQEYKMELRTAVKSLIPYDEPTQVANISEVTDTLETICPNSDIVVASRRKQMEVEFYLNLPNFLHPLAEDHEQRKRFGNTHVFYKNNIDGKPVYCNDETKVEKITKYINQVNENKVNEMSDFADILQKCISSRSLDPLEGYIAIKHDNNLKNNLRHIFRKYINGGWTLVDEDVLIANNFFIFEKDGRFEIIMLDTNCLNFVYQMQYDNSVIGNAKHDIKDNSEFLDSRRGHWLLMKAMALIAHKPGLFENGKIQAIEAVNLYAPERITADLSTLQKNWDMIISAYTHKRIPRVKPSLFMDDTTAKVRRAIDWIDAYGDTTYDFALKRHEKKIIEAYTREEIYKYLKDFVGTLGLTTFTDLSTKGSWELAAYNELVGAYLATFNIHMFTENGIGELWTDRNPGGTQDTPFGISQSAILRRLQNVNAIFEEDVTQRFNREIINWQLEFKKIYKETPDRKSNNNFFKHWFETDASDKISSSFTIKPIEELPANERKLATIFLDTLAKYRGWTPEEIVKYRKQRGSEYYQVPLIKATIIESLSNKGDILKSISDWWSRLGELDWEKALGLELTDSQRTNINPLDIRKLENVLLNGDPAQRKTLLDKGIDNYSCDLDKIINVVLGHSIRSELSETYIPAITGFRTFLQIELSYNPNADLETISTAVEEWIKSVIFGRSLVNPHEMFLLKLSALARQITSGTTLIGSFTSMTREMIVSTIANALDTKIIDPDLNDHDSWKMLGNAYWDTVQNLGSTVDITSMDQQLNTLFATAGINIHSLGKDTRSNSWNWRNFDSDFLYVFQTAPDYLHRLSYLKAKLMKRGSFKAYSINDAGVLTYDFEKDDYYAVYWKYRNNKRSEVPAADLEKYDFQKAAYEKAVASWKTMASYRDLELGQPLPQALSPEELMGVHNNCNLIHGFYNDSSKVLLQKHLVGAFFFQFKTVPLARMAMMFHPTQAINNPILQPVLDENGEQMYILISEEHPEGEFKTKKEIEDAGLLNSDMVKPYYASIGVPLTGKANISVEAITGLMSMIAKNDQEAWNKYWNDPWKRRTGFIALWDLLGMSIIAFILKLVFAEAEENIKDVDWLTRFSYTVLTGASQDRGLFNTVSSIVGDGAPPSMSIIKRYITTASSVISGDMPIAYGILSTFGATRPLSNIVADF